MTALAEQRLDKLTSLRFFAALMVVFFHSRVNLVAQHGLLQQLYVHLFAYGFMGVSVFYVLSGFVISYANDNWRGWKRYLAGRAIRIFPSHWIVTLLLILGWVILHYHLYLIASWRVDFANLLLLQAWIPDVDYYLSLNAVSWSLSVEVSFYAAFLLLRHLQSRHIYLLAILSYLVLVLVVALPYRWTDPYWVFYIDPLARLPEFLAGMALYRLYRADRLGGLHVPRFDFLLLLVTMVGLAAFLGSMKVHTIWFYSVFPLPFCVLIMISLLDERRSGYLRHKSLVLLGEASFALYLIHHPLIDFLNLVARNSFGGNALLVDLIAVAFCVVSSMVFYKFIESPLTRGLKSLFMDKAQARSPSSLLSG